MKRRRLIWLGTLAVMGIAAWLVWSRGPKEPVHGGKMFSEWVVILLQQEQFEPDRDPQKTAAARQAIRSIGTNAIPWLLAEFVRPESKWRMTFNQWAQRHRLNSSLRFEKRARAGASFAMRGFHLLGEDSAPALPTLAGYLGNPQLNDPAMRAMLACGEKALPYFIHGFASTNQHVAGASLIGLALSVRMFESAIPHVTNALQHSDAWRRHGAAHGLGWTSLRPELVVPALARALADPDADVRREVTDGLVRQWRFSRYAVPHLVQLKTNADPAIARAARNALHQISVATLQRPQ